MPTNDLARRRFLRAAAISGAALFVPRMALATVPTDRRFVFIIQRGAADGLDIVRPVSDPAFSALRAPFLKESAGTKLDPMFTLHPALVATADMYARGEALFIHAVASPYRDRSHFDGQNVLETGGAHPYSVTDGWLSRLITLMPRCVDKAIAIAIAPTIPMALRGHAEVASYAPSRLPALADDLMMRVTRLYDTDPQLHALWSSALAAEDLAADAAHGRDPGSLGKLTAGFLLKPNGPRIAMLETVGWDTHAAQAGRLAAQLKRLDALLEGLRDALGPAWAQTTVLVATEFGRTAAANGTGGTDHGTGALAMLIGGAVKGGRVIADWPGLAPSQLWQQRDLKPTTELNNLIAGAAGGSLGLDPGHISRLFQGNVRPLSGLFRS